MNGRQVALADRVKWSFFALMGLCVLLVLWTDERFWLNPADPHWKRIEPVRYLLMLHGLAELTALGAGAIQMSSQSAAFVPRSTGCSARSISARSPFRRRSPSTWAPARSSREPSASSRCSRAASGCSAPGSRSPASARARWRSTRRG